MSVSNQEEKTDNIEDGLQDLGIPVPIQTFLWGQLAPFIRPKLGKLHEAACMVCIFIEISPFPKLYFSSFVCVFLSSFVNMHPAITN